MATNERGGRVVLPILSWSIMGCAFLGLAAFRFSRLGLGSSLLSLAIDLMIGLSGLGIAFLTLRGSPR